MMDMLVRLYDLPDIEEDLRRLEREGFLIRRPGAYERHLVADWVGRNFSPKWVSEAKVAFGRQPISCYIATREKKILGFACYDVTARGFLGPMGVALVRLIFMPGLWARCLLKGALPASTWIFCRNHNSACCGIHFHF